MADFRISGFKRRLGKSTVRRTVVAVMATLVLGGAVTVPALGQNWWPFGNEPSKPRRDPVPSEPVYQDPATVPPNVGPGGAAGRGGSPICLELEQRLVQEGQRGSDVRCLAGRRDEC